MVKNHFVPEQRTTFSGIAGNPVMSLVTVFLYQLFIAVKILSVEFPEFIFKILDHFEN